MAPVVPPIICFYKSDDSSVVSIFKEAYIEFVRPCLYLEDLFEGCKMLDFGSVFTNDYELVVSFDFVLDSLKKFSFK